MSFLAPFSLLAFKTPPPRSGKRAERWIGAAGMHQSGTRPTWSLKSSAFRLSLLENRNVRVGVFPQIQKILIGGLCLASISR